MKLLIILFILFFPTSLNAQEPEVLKAFFGSDGIENKSAVYSGEMLSYFMKSPTLGQHLPQDAEISYRPLQQENDRAIYAVYIATERSSEDWYVYLVKEKNIWKISAVRKLALPPFFNMVIEEFEKIPDKSKEEDFRYQNMRLTLKTDAELKDYLEQNIDQFNKIVELSHSNLEAANSLGKSIYLNNISFWRNSKIIDVNIGGIIDNSVGYLYVPDGLSPPKMTSTDYIYVEKIRKNWFIYKTT